MNCWNETVLRLDPNLAPNARRLVDLISRFFIARDRCAFHGHEAAALLGISSVELRSAKHELVRKKYLDELPSAGRKPTYVLRHGQPTVFNGGNEAA